jgi:hypothetical protein
MWKLLRLMQYVSKEVPEPACSFELKQQFGWLSSGLSQQLVVARSAVGIVDAVGVD